MKKLFLSTAAIVATLLAACTGEPKERVPESVELNEPTLNMTAGAPAQTLVARVLPEDLPAESKAVKWTSDKTDIATVSDGGEVTPLKEGTAVITVTTVKGGKTATCTVTVGEATVPVESVVIAQGDKATVAMDETLQLTAVITPEGATNQKVAWTSEAPATATVDGTGLVTPVALGKTKVTVTTEDGKFTAVCEIEVVPAPVRVKGISLSTTEGSAGKGQTTDLVEVIFDPADATNKNVSWKSDDESVATVEFQDSNPLKVKMKGGTKAGTTTLTVTSEDGDKTATYTMTVNPTLPQSIKIFNGDVDLTTNPDAVLPVTMGTPIQLTAKVFPDDTDDKDVEWTVERTNVPNAGSYIFVSSTGAISGLQPADKGLNLYVVATSKANPEVRAATRVTVHPVCVTQILGIPTELTVKVGQKGTVPKESVQILPENATYKDLGIRRVNGTGKISVPGNSSWQFDAQAVGTATIIITAGNGTYDSSDDCVVECKVTVIE